MCLTFNPIYGNSANGLIENMTKSDQGNSVVLKTPEQRLCERVHMLIEEVRILKEEVGSIQRKLIISALQKGRADIENLLSDKKGKIT